MGKGPPMSEEKIVKEDLLALARALKVEETGTRREVFERCLEKARAMGAAVAAELRERVAAE